jgi:hypothetical protein
MNSSDCTGVILIVIAVATGILNSGRCSDVALKGWLTMVLEKEIETYHSKLPELLAHQGKFVVIHEGDVIGFFDTYADAVQAGYDKCGLESFLVKQVQEVEQVQFITASPCPA